MALTLKRQPAAPEQPEQDILTIHIDTSTPAARRALDIGLLEAKTEAYEDTGKLLRFGRPLLLAVIGVSFLHIFDTVSTYKPEDVTALHVAPWLHHISTGALVLAIDAVLAYYIAAGNAIKMATGKTASWPLVGFIGLTFALNMAYMVRYAPHIDEGFRATMQQWLDTFFVFALSAFVPAAIIAVEYATHLVKTARLRLLVETRTLQERTNGQSTGKASQSVNGRSTAFNRNEETVETATAKIPETDRLLGGRKTAATLAELLAAIDGRSTINRNDAIELLGCGRTKTDELLAEAVEAGKLEKAGRGVYKIL